MLALIISIYILNNNDYQNKVHLVGFSKRVLSSLKESSPKNVEQLILYHYYDLSLYFCDLV